MLIGFSDPVANNYETAKANKHKCSQKEIFYIVLS